MSLVVDYNGVEVTFDDEVVDELDVISYHDREVEILGYDANGVEYSAVGMMSCEELVEIYDDTVWPCEGETFVACCNDDVCTCGDDEGSN